MNKQMKQNESNGKYALPGQPNPITVTFEELRNCAIATPILKADFSQEDISITRHSKVYDFNSNFILAVVVIAFLKDKNFYWQIHSFFVSKLNGKNIKFDLLTRNQKASLELVKEQALGDCGISSASTNHHSRNSFVWNIPFSASDYEKLNPAFLELTN
jgi:hypothetical protein